MCQLAQRKWNEPHKPVQWDQPELLEQLQKKKKKKKKKKSHFV